MTASNISRDPSPNCTVCGPRGPDNTADPGFYSATPAGTKPTLDAAHNLVDYLAGTRSGFKDGWIEVRSESDVDPAGGATPTEAKRSRLLPDVPTVGETVPGYEMTVWYGAFGPPGLPADVVGRINAEIGRILYLPDVKTRMENIAVEVAKSTPEELAAMTRRDAEKWTKTIKDLGINVQPG